MPWVRFTRPFDWWLRPRIVQSFKAGEERLVTTPCANAAIKADAAVRIKRPEGTNGR